MDNEDMCMILLVVVVGVLLISLVISVQNVQIEHPPAPAAIVPSDRIESVMIERDIENALFDEGFLDRDLSYTYIDKNCDSDLAAHCREMAALGEHSVKITPREDEDVYQLFLLVVDMDSRSKRYDFQQIHNHHRGECGVVDNNGTYSICVAWRETAMEQVNGSYQSMDKICYMC